MTASIQKDRVGPDWPLGYINVATPGTPIGIMSVVDPTGVNDPASPTPGTPGADEFTVRAQQIVIQAYKPGPSHGMVRNVGDIYVVRKGVSPGTGNRDDTGSIIFVLEPGQTLTLASAPLNRNVFNPYRYSIDADNANEGAIVTLIIQ
jgi:hypothetical protein